MFSTRTDILGSRCFFQAEGWIGIHGWVGLLDVALDVCGFGWGCWDGFYLDLDWLFGLGWSEVVSVEEV